LIPVETYKRPALSNDREDERSRRSLRFLIVDDTEELREPMARMVVRAGHVAEEAADGIEATAALAAHRYDVMLLDLSMPRMSGEDVVRWLHANPDRADGMRTVVVTAWGGERRGTLQELGITTVLTKPFRLRQFLDLISDITAEWTEPAIEGRRVADRHGR
jgi:CheY-like chemotaxis protein